MKNKEVMIKDKRWIIQSVYQSYYLNQRFVLVYKTVETFVTSKCDKQDCYKELWRIKNKNWEMINKYAYVKKY